MCLSAPHSRDDPTIQLAAAGDASARRQLVERYGPGLWAVCRRLSHEPEDAYQEIWAKVLAALPRFDPRGTASLKTWMMTIANRWHIDHYRRRRTRGTVVSLEALPPRPADMDGRLTQHQRQARLEAALTRLPEAQRRVVVLHHLQGIPLETLADDLEVAVGTIKSRLHRGRARLAQILEHP